MSNEASAIDKALSLTKTQETAQSTRALLENNKTVTLGLDSSKIDSV